MHAVKFSIEFFCPEKQYLVDNAEMIVYLEPKIYNKKVCFKPREIDKADFNPRERTDMVEVKWK